MFKPKFFNKILVFILNILFPIYCQGCNKKEEVLCDECLLNIKLSDKTTQKDIFAVFDYHDPLIKKIIWQLKYQKQKYLGEKLGKILYDFSKEEIAGLKIFSTGKPIIVISVPSSKKILRKRGFNQAVILAKSFCKENQQDLRYFNNLISKEVETIHQVKTKNKETRLKNTRGVFVLNPKINIKGRTIMVIDDVTTTGGTLLEIIKTLKKAGAKKVIGLALAH
jgi:competence protein ComFC